MGLDRHTEVSKQLESLAKEITTMFMDAKDLKEWRASFELIKQFHTHGDILVDLVLNAGIRAGLKSEIKNKEQ